MLHTGVHKTIRESARFNKITKSHCLLSAAHILCIKDMAGLLKPRASKILVSALRERHPGTTKWL